MMVVTVHRHTVVLQRLRPVLTPPWWAAHLLCFLGLLLHCKQAAVSAFFGIANRLLSVLFTTKGYDSALRTGCCQCREVHD